MPIFTNMISENYDVLTKIFLLLPTKALISLKLVCKYWRSLISDRHFSHSHTMNGRRSKPEPTFLLHRPKATQYYLLHCSLYSARLVQFPTDLVTPTICSFSNGLFLLRCDSLETAPEYCHVYNPTTRQSRKILMVHGLYTRVMGMTIAFDPLKSPHFKIICVRAGRSSGMLRNLLRPCQIQMYESATNTWKFCDYPFYVPVKMDFNRGVYWNDGIYWRGISFDLNDEEVEIEDTIIRDDDDGDAVVSYVVEANGYLNCIAHFSKENLIEVFELQDKNSVWVPKLQLSYAGDSGKLSLLGIYWGESEEDIKLVVHDHETGKVMTCGFEDEEFKEVVVVGAKMELFEKNCDHLFSSQFLETLAHV